MNINESIIDELIVWLHDHHDFTRDEYGAILIDGQLFNRRAFNTLWVEVRKKFGPSGSKLLGRIIDSNQLIK